MSKVGLDRRFEEWNDDTNTSRCCGDAFGYRASDITQIARPN
jgi:hypothetical protein